jgi:hypothetical protein
MRMESTPTLGFWYNLSRQMVEGMRTMRDCEEPWSHEYLTSWANDLRAYAHRHGQDYVWPIIRAAEDQARVFADPRAAR